jgi:leader peptidase (prepilin peptidase)/N-methyltransferase
MDSTSSVISHADILQAISIGVAIWVGLCIGSFLNVVAYRWPIMQERKRERMNQGEQFNAITKEQPFNLSVPRSRCPSCGHPIAWYENIPVLSYLALRGKCSACQTPISLRYPLVEAAVATLFGLWVWLLGAGVAAALGCAASAVTIAWWLLEVDRYMQKSGL